MSCGAELEHRSNERLLFITGGVDGGPQRGSIVKGSLRSCIEHALPHETLDHSELRRRFPSIPLQQRNGGGVSTRCRIRAVGASHHRVCHGSSGFGRRDSRLWARPLEVKRRRVLIRTDHGVYQARSLVITAGAWAAKVLPVLRKPRLAVPERQVVIWTQPRRPEYFRLGAFPIFNMDAFEGRRTNHYYGLPIFGYPGFKFGSLIISKRKLIRTGSIASLTAGMKTCCAGPFANIFPTPMVQPWR